MVGVVMLFYRRRKQEATNMEEPEQHQENITVIRAVTSGIDRVVAEHQADRNQTAALETGRRYREYATIGALLLAAAAALLTLIVTHCDTRDLITETQTAAKQQHNDTIKSNQISREAYTSVQRAFVFVKELQFTTRTGMDPLNPGNYPELWWFSPIIENSGNTPTKSLQVLLIASCAYTPLGILFGIGPQQSIACEDIPPAGPRDPEDLFLDRTQNNLKVISTALGPRSTFSIGGIGVPLFYIEETVNAGKTFHYYGVMHYVDIFDAPHMTKFCYVIGPDKSKSGKLEPSIGICNHWNCVDQDDCKKDKEAYIEETKGWVPRPIVILGAPSKETELPQVSPELRQWQRGRTRPELPEVPHHQL